MEKFDVIVIGSGPGGYVCSIKLAQLGLKVGCVEGRKKLGGTCLNVGCIPSKALLHASHSFHESTHNFSRMGINIGETDINWDQMIGYKNSMIEENTKGIEYLFKKNNVSLIEGWAKFEDQETITVGDNIYKSKNFVIATGSESTTINNIEIDEKIIVSSTGALELKEIPNSMIIVGAGVIGLEMGSIYNRLGTKVEVVEYFDKVLNGMDKDISTNFKSILQKQGFKFHLKSSVESVVSQNKKGIVTFLNQISNKKIELSADIVLIATGRKPFTNGLDIEKLNIQINSKGQIKTNSKWQTSAPNIYAIGDVVAGPMLAHKAEDEGIAVAEIIAGQAGHVNFDVIPNVVYTNPEVASVGKTETELTEAGIKFKSGKFSFMGNGRAKTVFSSSGFVKIIVDAKTDKILGVHIIGPSAGDLIHEVCVAMEFGACSEDLARTCHAHPTFSEAIREAALACGDGAIHA